METPIWANLLIHVNSQDVSQMFTDVPFPARCFPPNQYVDDHQEYVKRAPLCFPKIFQSS